MLTKSQVRCSYIVTLVLAMCALAAAPAQGGPVLLGCGGPDFAAECSLAELLAGGSIQIDDKLFHDFRFYDSRALDNNPTGDTRPADAARIGVFPISGIQPGLLFLSGEFFAGLNDLQHTEFDYNVTIVAGNDRIQDNKLILDVFSVAPGGLLRLFEEVVTPGIEFKEIIVNGPAFGPPERREVRFFDPTVMISVHTEIDLANRAELEIFRQEFSQVVPEPGSILLFGVALGSALRRCRSRRRPSHPVSAHRRFAREAEPCSHS
jgi:hypothetical protein